ncbi:MAG TPA: protein phosphatase 2C domain-containing protein [Roseiflexaceae bacterium]|nr:protein phosphatase 2C domain-containing protein [Roseiflexaceae bacterium]
MQEPHDSAASHEPGTRPLREPEPADPTGDAPGTKPLARAGARDAGGGRGQLVAAALRDIGRVRQVNQDHVFALTATLPREGGDLQMGLFIVADGMGGHEGGEVASRMAISAAVRHVLAELLVPALDESVSAAIRPMIVAAIQEANRAIWEHARAIGSDMGTTCTLALLLGHTLHLGHVGDTRAYLVSPREIRRLTEDHSAVSRLIELGQLDAADAREHPMRSQLYRTVGQQPEVAVDVVTAPQGDATHLLLASDGLWSLVDDESMRAVVIGAATPQAACEELVARANAAGGDDNISAVVVHMSS